IGDYLTRRLGEQCRKGTGAARERMCRDSSERLAPPRVSPRGLTGAPPWMVGWRNPSGGWIGAYLSGFSGPRHGANRVDETIRASQERIAEIQPSGGLPVPVNFSRLVSTVPGKVPGSATARVEVLQPGRHGDLVVKHQAYAW